MRTRVAGAPARKVRGRELDAGEWAALMADLQDQADDDLDGAPVGGGEGGGFLGWLVTPTTGHLPAGRPGGRYHVPGSNLASVVVRRP